MRSSHLIDIRTTASIDSYLVDGDSHAFCIAIVHAIFSGCAKCPEILMIDATQEVEAQMRTPLLLIYVAMCRVRPFLSKRTKKNHVRNSWP